MITLQGTVSMELHNEKTRQRASKFLKAGDMLILEGSARYEWKHAIPKRLDDYDPASGRWLPRSEPRIALVFRSTSWRSFEHTRWCLCRMCRHHYIDWQPVQTVGFCLACLPSVKSKWLKSNAASGISYERPFLCYSSRKMCTL